MGLAHTGFELVINRTREREFLDKMNLVIPLTELLALIAPHAPAGKAGRPPLLKTGTVVDVTLISAPSSTKNDKGECDPKCTRPRRATSGTLA